MREVQRERMVAGQPAGEKLRTAEGRTGKQSHVAKETLDLGVGTAKGSEPPTRHNRPQMTYS